MRAFWYVTVAPVAVERNLTVMPQASTPIQVLEEGKEATIVFTYSATWVVLAHPLFEPLMC